MHLVDDVSKKKLNTISIFLTLSEAQELRDTLNSLIKKPLNNHAHISNYDYDREITIAIYDEQNLGDFSQEARDIILSD
jgi:hypothetical protein